MKVKLTTKEVSTRYQFDIQLHRKSYRVVVYLNEKGKFIDDEISHNDTELEYEGSEGELREKIIDYLDKNWDTLTA